MKKMRRLLAVLVMVMSLAAFMTEIPVANTAVGAVTAEAASLNKKTLTLSSWRTYQLKVKGSNGKTVRWSSSNKRIATVTSKGKVTAKAAGKCKIRAKVGGRTYSCPLTVKKNEWSSGITDSTIEYYIDKSYDVDVNLQKAYYSSGKLVVKAYVTNNSVSSSIKKIQLSLINKATGTTIIKSPQFTMSPYLYKGDTMLYTFKYPKAAVRDLRKINTIRWTWTYWY